MLLIGRNLQQQPSHLFPTILVPSVRRLGPTNSRRYLAACSSRTAKCFFVALVVILATIALSPYEGFGIDSAALLHSRAMSRSCCRVTTNMASP